MVDCLDVILCLAGPPCWLCLFIKNCSALNGLARSSGRLVLVGVGALIILGLVVAAVVVILVVGLEVGGGDEEAALRAASLAGPSALAGSAADVVWQSLRTKQETRLEQGGLKVQRGSLHVSTHVVSDTCDGVFVIADARHMSLIAPIPPTDSLQTLAALEPSTYYYAGALRTGFVGAKLAEHAPDAVRYASSSTLDQVAHVDVVRLVPLLVGAIQALHEEIERARAQRAAAAAATSGAPPAELGTRAFM